MLNGYSVSPSTPYSPNPDNKQLKAHSERTSESLEKLRRRHHGDLVHELHPFLCPAGPMTLQDTLGKKLLIALQRFVGQLPPRMRRISTE